MSGSGLGTTSLCSHSITSISLAPHPLLFYPYLHLGPLFPIHCAYSMMQLTVYSACLLFAKELDMPGQLNNIKKLHEEGVCD